MSRVPSQIQVAASAQQTTTAPSSLLSSAKSLSAPPSLGHTCAPLRHGSSLQSLSYPVSRQHSSDASDSSSLSSPTTSSSPAAPPSSTPTSSGIPSPLEELEEPHMSKPLVARASELRHAPNRDQLFNQWRPSSHFLGPHGWMNDPCGPSYDPRTGLYHLWYQWNPNASTWGSICWGHAYSRDMIHWTSRPQPVIVPGANLDSEGVFTGCVLHRSPLGTSTQAAESGEMTALYTAVSKLPIHHTLPYSPGCEKIVMSTSTDGGRNWVPQGVVVSGPPKDLDVISWRDPYVAQWPLLDALLGHAGQTAGLYALIAGGIKDRTPTTFAYSIDPTDLSQWTFVGTLADVGVNCKAEPHGVDLGKNWEVANFFTITDKAAVHSDAVAASAEYLLINAEGCTEPGPARASIYIKLDLGATRLDDGEIRLQPAHVGLLDHGCLYAASSFNDEKHNRRIVWGWITEDDLAEDYYDTQGWSGLISLPRELFHHPTSSELGIRPVEEVYKLRQGAEHIVVTAEASGPSTMLELEGAVSATASPVEAVASRSYEVEMELTWSQPGLVVAHSKDLSTRTMIYLSESGHLVVDRSRSAGKESVIARAIDVNVSTLRAPVSQTATGTHKLRLFVDNSVLEIFVDDLVALSTRIYPDVDDMGLSVLLRPETATGGQIDVWQGLDKALVA